jgi:hypothetical protein
MPTAIQNSQITRASLGWLTQRPGTASGNGPLALGPTNLFTISGGRILLRALIGTVTTIIQAQATTIQLIATPTAGTAVNLSNATLDLTGKEVGASIVLGATLGSTAVAGNAGGNGLVQLNTILQVGTINVTYGAASTGAIKWDMIWTPIDPAASVVATA